MSAVITSFYKWNEKIRKELTSSEYKVYTYIYDHRDNETGAMSYKQSTIANNVNLGTATISRAIKSLANKGYIAISKLNKVIGNLNKYICNIAWFVEKKDSKKENNDIVDTDIEDLECNNETSFTQDFEAKIISETKINKITKAQKETIHEFSTHTILRVLASKKGKCSRYASYFIDLLITEATKNGSLKDFQVKKLGCFKGCK